MALKVLGLSGFYHDSAAALMVDGVLVAAAEEERFTRKKHDASFPSNAARYCLSHAGVAASDLDRVVFYDKPIPKLDRVLSTFVSTWPRSYGVFLDAMPPFLSRKLWVAGHVRRELGWTGRVLYSDHHLSHAASAALLSGFEETAILTLDGVGEWATSTGGESRGGRIETFWEARFPHSIGLLYSAFTQYLGFRVNSAEYKVMGLAPYGRPLYRSLILHRLLDLRDDGSFRLNLDYFEFTWGRQMIGSAFETLFGRRARAPESELAQFHCDVAASIQSVLDEVVLRLARDLRTRTGLDRLCMAGGVALNCVTNEHVRRNAGFRELFIQPAAGDSGGAVGAAALATMAEGHGARTASLRHVYLGPEFSEDDVTALIGRVGAVAVRLEDGELLRETARRLAHDRVVGWFQGRMEFGPRALGNRSILADARSPEMRELLNRKIKFREGFRPFAPAVPEESAAAWFEVDGPRPYMLLTAQVRDGKTPIPAVTHVDGSARLQTVSRETNPLFHALLETFGELTGVPVLVNTSFNVRGEPIVCTPADAWRCFMGSGIDDLVLGSYILRKEDQPEADVTQGPTALD